MNTIAKKSKFTRAGHPFYLQLLKNRKYYIGSLYKNMHQVYFAN